MGSIVDNAKQAGLHRDLARWTRQLAQGGLDADRLRLLAHADALDAQATRLEEQVRQGRLNAVT
jgi:hypothetical protein